MARHRSKASRSNTPPAINPGYFVEASDKKPWARYMSITADEDNRTKSFEEIRLQNYASKITTSAPKPCEGHASVKWSSAVMAHLPTMPSNFGTSIGLETITFRVGRDDNFMNFSINADIILARSEFVRLVVRDRSEGAMDRVIFLPDLEQTSFEIYRQWLRNGRICSSPRPEEQDREYEYLVKAYVVGEKFGDVDFKDILIDAIIGKLLRTGSFGLRLTGLMYANTKPESPLRRLWLDIYYHSGTMEWIDENSVEGGIDAGFLYDYCRWQISKRNALVSYDVPYVKDPCVYHQHGDEKCYLSKRLLVYLPQANVTTPRVLPVSHDGPQYSTDPMDNTESAENPIKEEPQADSTIEAIENAANGVDGGAIMEDGNILY